MAAQAPAKQAASAPSAAAAPKSNMMMIAGIIVVVVIIAAAVFFLYKPSPATGTGSGGSTIGSGGSGQLSGGGPGQGYMSQSEASQLLGAGGTYNATYLSGYSASHEFSHNASIFTNNVSAAYVASYGLNTSSSHEALLDIVFQSSKAQFLYAHAIANASRSSSFNTTNATVNGMTYSYLNAGGYLQELIGYKGTDLALVLVVGHPVAETQLAAIVAGDLP